MADEVQECPSCDEHLALSAIACPKCGHLLRASYLVLIVATGTALGALVLAGVMMALGLLGLRLFR